MKSVFVYSTFPNREIAEKISEQCIKHGIAACTNMIKLEQSCYLWKGKCEKQKEFAVLFKTTHGRLMSLIHFLRENHPYKVPLIASFDADVNPEYFSWMLGKHGR
jgi:periplasmic divalent cation tolerance protein